MTFTPVTPIDLKRLSEQAATKIRAKHRGKKDDELVRMVMAHGGWRFNRRRDLWVWPQDGSEARPHMKLEEAVLLGAMGRCAQIDLLVQERSELEAKLAALEARA